MCHQDCPAPLRGGAPVQTEDVLIDEQLYELLVLQNRHARFPRAAADQNLSLQSNHLWPRSANSRAGRLVRSSKDWFRCG